MFEIAGSPKVTPQNTGGRRGQEPSPAGRATGGGERPFQSGSRSKQTVAHTSKFGPHLQQRNRL